MDQAGDVGTLRNVLTAPQNPNPTVLCRAFFVFFGHFGCSQVTEPPARPMSAGVGSSVEPWLKQHSWNGEGKGMTALMVPRAICGLSR